MGRMGRRQRGAGAKTIDPRIYFRVGGIIAGGDRSACADKAFRLPGVTVALLGRGFGGGRLPGVRFIVTMGGQYSPACSRRPGGCCR